MKYFTHISIVIMFLFGLVACGGGGGSSAPTSSSLAGTWAGFYEDNYGAVANASLQIVIDSNGNITSVLQDGAALTDSNSVPITGTLKNIGGNKFSFLMSDGTTGGFLVDAGQAHAGFIDQYGDFGAVQKGASISGVSYSPSDFAGNWSGYTVVLNDAGDVTNQGNSSATVAASTYAVSGTDYDGVSFTGYFGNGDASFGWAEGSWYKGTQSGYLRAYATPDKLFAATFACPSGDHPSTAPGLSYCTYSIWNKQ